jgi:peptide methionine sulfoxide reductase msrA/msrB
MKKLMLLSTLVMVALFALQGCSLESTDKEVMTDEEIGEGGEVPAYEMTDKEVMTDSTDMTDQEKEIANMMNEGNIAPNFELSDLMGNVHNLEQYKGQKVYVKFWASWCSICLAGLDELNTFSGQTEDFVVITIVSPDYNGEKSVEDFTNWFTSLGYDNIVVLLDENGDVAKDYGIRGYPTSAYIGSDGILVGTIPGHNTSEAINENMEGIY